MDGRVLFILVSHIWSHIFPPFYWRSGYQRPLSLCLSSRMAFGWLSKWVSGCFSPKTRLAWVGLAFAQSFLSVFLIAGTQKGLPACSFRLFFRPSLPVGLLGLTKIPIHFCTCLCFFFWTLRNCYSSLHLVFGISPHVETACSDMGWRDGHGEKPNLYLAWSFFSGYSYFPLTLILNENGAILVCHSLCLHIWRQEVVLTFHTYRLTQFLPGYSICRPVPIQWFPPKCLPRTAANRAI